CSPRSLPASPGSTALAGCQSASTRNGIFFSWPTDVGQSARYPLTGSERATDNLVQALHRAHVRSRGAVAWQIGRCAGGSNWLGPRILLLRDRRAWSNETGCSSSLLGRDR